MSRLPLYLLIICLVLARNAAAQYDVNWHMGNLNGITFRSGSPQPTPSAMQALEGVASISDASGNILFYCNGVKVWNRNHVVMPNGNGIQGHLSSSQGVAIIPIPNSRKYYLFTVTAAEAGDGSLSYSIIDMDLDGGLGDVEQATKNTLLSIDNTERLVVASGPGCFYWLISHKKRIGIIEARKVDARGISSPVSSTTKDDFGQLDGNMKMTTDDSQLVIAVSGYGNFSGPRGIVGIYNFDNQSGTFSNALQFPPSANALVYSACFSPDKSKLYVAEGRQNNRVDFIQYDLSVNDSATIVNSRATVGGATTNGAVSMLQYTASDLQLGPDGRMYFSLFHGSCIGSIPFPNLLTPNCGFDAAAFCNMTFSSLCFPNSIRVKTGLEAFSLGADTSLCVGGSITLQAPLIGNSFLWSTGSTATSITVTTPGTYWVQISNGSCVSSDTIKISFEHRKANLGPDTTVCTGNTIRIRPGNYSAYLWQDGSTGSFFPVTSPGLYWVEVTDNCGRKSRDSINITERIFPVTLGPDRRLCLGDTLQLQAPGTFTNHQWGPAYHLTSVGGTAIVSPQSDTAYYVQAEVMPGCFAFDTVRINVVSAQRVQLPADTAICAGSTYPIPAGSGFRSYLWQDGSTAPVLRVRDSLLAWVEVKDSNGCSSRDSIEVKWTDCGQDLWIPNSFTPNGDGKNDRFKVSYKGYVESFRLTVYNRWGGIVFTTTNPDQAWNGSLSDGKMDTGVFVWMCTYKLYGRKPVTEKGTVTLIR